MNTRLELRRNYCPGLHIWTATHIKTRKTPEITVGSRIIASFDSVLEVAEPGEELDRDGAIDDALGDNPKVCAGVEDGAEAGGEIVDAGTNDRGIAAGVGPGASVGSVEGASAGEICLGIANTLIANFWPAEQWPGNPHMKYLVPVL